MTKCIENGPYSYRSDSAVPAFNDARPIAFMDGACALCCIGARAISKLDQSGNIRICPVQCALGRAVLQHYEIDVEDPESWLYLERGKAYSGLDGMIRVAIYTGRAPGVATALSHLPDSWRAWIYRRIARNRYWFGRSDICQIPSPNLRARLMQ